MLAIVIPYYNHAFFEKTLTSLANQTNKQFNVYIGDDASTNSPKFLVQAVEDKLNITYTKFNTNLGSISLVEQWQRCIDLVQDETWLMVLGDDDALDSNCIEQFYIHLDSIEKQAISVVKFATRVIDANSKIIYDVFKHPEIEPATYAFYRKLRKYTRSSLSEHIFKKETYEKHKFKDFPLAWYSDDLAWLEFSNFKNIYTINDAVVSIRYSNKSISGKQDNLDKKEAARFQFLSILVFKYLNCFSVKQRDAILAEYQLLEKNYKALFWYGPLLLRLSRVQVNILLSFKKLKSKLKSMSRF